MAHTNSTTNYALPQFIGSDKPAWLTDVNNAMSAIDTQMKLNADAAASAQTDATNAGTAAGNAATAATNAQTAATNAQNTANAQAGSIATLQNKVAALEGSVAALNSYKHIISSTTSGDWRIDRYSDGTIRGRYEGNVTFNSASTILNGWHRSVQNFQFPFNVITATADAYGNGANNARLFAVIYVNSQNTVECQLLSGASIPAGTTVTNATIIVEGIED